MTNDRIIHCIDRNCCQNYKIPVSSHTHFHFSTSCTLIWHRLLDACIYILSWNCCSTLVFIYYLEICGEIHVLIFNIHTYYIAYEYIIQVHLIRINWHLPCYKIYKFFYWKYDIYDILKSIHFYCYMYMYSTVESLMDNYWWGSKYRLHIYW